MRLGRRAAGPWPSEQLGLLERWYAAQPVARVAGCILEFAEPLDRAKLASALTALSARHSTALEVTLGRTSSGAHRFAACASRTVPFADEPTEDPWSIAERELTASFPHGEPLWRVRLDSTGRGVVAVFHHVIADGISTSIFARELLALLRGEPLAPLERRRLPLDGRIDLRPTLGLLAREAMKDARRTLPADYRGPAEDRGPRRTRLYPLELPAELLKNLVDRTRAMEVTGHAALCLAGLVAVAAGHTGFPLRASLLSPVSLRPRASPAPTGFGVFLCGHEAVQRLSASDPFWRAVGAYRDELRSALPEAYERIGLLRFAGNLSARAEKMTNEPNARTSTLEVSNLGRLDGLQDAKVWFVQGNHYHGPLFNLSVGTCTATGVLRASLSVADPVIDPDTARAFVRGIVRALEHAVMGSPTLGDVLGALAQ